MGIMVVTCKVTSPSNLQIIENYIKSINYIDAIDIEVPHLSQSKFYLKIIGIPYYFQCNSSNYLLFKDIEDIIK